MLSQQTTKSHKVKWAEAERELAIRGVFLPPHPVNHEYFSTPKSTFEPQTGEERDLEEIAPYP